MGFLDFFKKMKGYNLPKKYIGIVTREEYNFIINTSIQYHKENRFVIIKISEGEIVVEIDGEVKHRYLDQLLSVISTEKQINWKNLIYEYFNKLKYNPAAIDYLYKNFNYASQFLRVLIKGESFVMQNDVKDCISTIDFPKTNTFLVLEFEGQFHYIIRDERLEWKKENEELFEIAISNTPKNEIAIKEYNLIENVKMFGFYSNDYSASYLLNFKRDPDYIKGTFGTLIAIPTKEAALVFPIENKNVMVLINIINPDVTKFYSKNPGRITLNYYWLYDNEFHIFPSEKAKDNPDEKIIKLPKKLIELLMKEN